jgi:TolB-like protein/class 3 adenylate cyclase
VPAQQSSVRLEIGHVLFIDIVEYSKLLITEQSELLRKLTSAVLETEQFRIAEAEHKLVRLPTGDGMALVFRNSPEAPVQCALELSKWLKSHPELRVRMGIHSGPVNEVVDVNGRTNITGAGINVAQRVMDCGDAGHILLSKHVADDLEEYPQWRPLLHDLGECEVKHGARVSLVNLYTDELGNSQTPAKLRNRERVAPPKKTNKKWVLIGVALLLVTLVIALLFRTVGTPLREVPQTEAGRPRGASLPIPEKSVAVLPFENLSEEKENAYFAGGVQDEILADLAKIADLKVISRTSVMKYRSGPERNLREIAKTLGVSHVVEGSVQRAEGRVRVSAQLIDARNDAHLWAEHYDRDFADIFAIQSEIAQKIADQLRAKLSETEKAVIAERPTSDLVAYAFYTKAKELDTWTNWEGDEKNLNQKVELLEKATQRDPNFALAYCALAKTQIDLYSVTGEPEDRKHLELAKKAADAALQLRPDLGEAHLEVARYYFYAFDYGRAREELKVVRSKLPNNAEALVIEAMIGRHENRWDASLADLQKANDLDPRNNDVVWRLGQIYFEMRRYSEYEQLRKKQAASGILDNLSAQSLLARLKLAQGDPVGAQSLLEQVPLDYSPDPWVWGIRFTTALYLRDYDAADRVIAATPAKWADFAFGEQTSSWAEGQVARARGDKEKAVAAFAAARKKMEAKFPDNHDAVYLSEVAILDAGLGKKEEAIREARRAVELLPIGNDAVNAPGLIAKLALIYAWTGERERALEQLEKVATIPGAMGSVPTYGDLRFNPCWDDLRADPRFEKIVASFAPKDATLK